MENERRRRVRKAYGGLLAELRLALCEWLLGKIAVIAPSRNVEGLILRDTVRVYFELKAKGDAEVAVMRERHERVMANLK